MHLVCFPITIVFLAILVCQSAVALLHIIDPFTVIHVAVWKDVHALPMHLAIKPVTLIDTSICILIFPLAMHFAIHPIALKFLHNASPGTHVGHHALPMPLIVTPLALVDVTLCISVRAPAVHLSVIPLTIILVIVGIRQCAISVDATILPGALVAISRCEYRNSLAMDSVLDPLALEDRTILVGELPVPLALAEHPLAIIAFVARIDKLSFSMESTILNLPIVSVACLSHRSTPKHQSRLRHVGGVGAPSGAET
mmetsp:Transcript_79734/g.145516  ORF Transcript_79734/g.145516 Transcript_79734/m.145516 type:complete len:255 (+) Transcript_79734:642-1406(+)